MTMTYCKDCCLIHDTDLKPLCKDLPDGGEGNYQLALDSSRRYGRCADCGTWVVLPIGQTLCVSCRPDREAADAR